MRCGRTYYATLRATSCAGLSRTVASNPVKLCCNEPNVGVVRLTDSNNQDVDALNTRSTELRLVWDGFRDECAGIRSYSYQVVDVTLSRGASHPIYRSDGMDTNVTGTGTGTSTTVALPDEVTRLFEDGSQYAFIVQAISHANRQAASSVSMFFDEQPPSIGQLFSGSSVRSNVGCMDVNDPVYLSWDHVVDESGFTEHAWAVGTLPGATDLFGWVVIEDVTTAIGANSSAPHIWQPAKNLLRPGMIVYASLRVTDLAGNTAISAANGVRVLAAAISGELGSSLTCLPPIPEPLAEARTNQMTSEAWLAVSDEGGTRRFGVYPALIALAEADNETSPA